MPKGVSIGQVRTVPRQKVIDVVVDSTGQMESIHGSFLWKMQLASHILRQGFQIRIRGQHFQSAK